VVHIDEGFDFLGFYIRRMRKRGTSKQYVYTTPSRKSIQSIKDKVSELTYRSTRHKDLAEVLTRLNQALAEDGRTTSGTECPRPCSARSTATRGAG
jgi:RNA-directed DNA polymerase